MLFADAWLLWPAGAVLLGTAWLLRRRRPPAVVFSSLGLLAAAPSWRARLAGLPAGLRLAALVLAALALARPQQGDVRTLVRSQGLALQMVLDRSSSMSEEIAAGDRRRPKIELVREIFTDFIRGGGGLPGRAGDLVGLITFARFPEQDCPLVTQHEPLVAAVQQLKTMAPFLTPHRRPTRRLPEADPRDPANPLDRTAIGDALKRAVLSLVTAEEDVARAEKRGTYRITGQAAIVLTDGLNNAGDDPREAGRLAQENGVRVYFVVLYDANRYAADPFTGEPVVAGRWGPEHREEVLALPREIAALTGGRAFLADDAEALRAIYREIDALEKSDVGRLEFRQYNERFRLFLLPAGLLLLLEFLLAETLLRRAP